MIVLTISQGGFFMSEDFLIGTYTKKSSKGIYAVTLDRQKEQLRDVRLVITSQKPAYLQTASHNHLFAIRQEKSDAGVAAYHLTSGAARLVDKSLTPGPAPAYVGVDEQRHLLFAANYHKATIEVYHFDLQGKLTKTDEVTHQGIPGPRPEQADGAHCHYADLTPDKRLIVCDLGLDLVVIYNINRDGQLLAANRFQTPAGFGPRHLTFSPDGHFCYLLGELSSKLLVLKYDKSTAKLNPLQMISTIPADWTSHNGAAAIHLSADGRFLYCSNRGENTLAVFAVQPDGTLKHIQSITTAGDFPRDFELSADGKFVIASNQNTDNLTLYRRDLQTGHLTLLQENVVCPEPVCVKRWHY